MEHTDLIVQCAAHAEPLKKSECIVQFQLLTKQLKCFDVYLEKVVVFVGTSGSSVALT